MLAGDFEQLRRALPLLPQRGAPVGVHPRHEQGARRALAEARGEQRGSAHLVGHDPLELVGLEDEQLGAGRLRVGVRHADDDAVVARDRRPLHPEALADAGVHGQGPRRMDLLPVGRVQDHAPVADLIAAALDGQRAVGGQRARRLLLLVQVREQVRLRTVVEPGGAEPLPRLLGRRALHLAVEDAEGLAELERATESVAVPERHLARLPVGRDHVDPVVRDLGDPPARGAESEHVADPRLVDHLLVEFADACAGRLPGDEDAEQPAVGDRAAARDRDPLRAGASGERAGVAIPDETRAQLGELVGGEAPGEQIQRRLVRRAGERGEGRTPAHRVEPLLHVEGVQRARGDGLLREDVEGVPRHADRLDLPREHALGDDRGVQHVAAVLGEQRGTADLADLVSRATHALQSGCGGGRGLHLDHEVDRAHVDAELEAARRDDAAQHARLELLLDDRPLLLGDRAVVRLGEHRIRSGGRTGLRHHGRGWSLSLSKGGRRQVESDPFAVDLVQPPGEALGEAARIGEHDRRAVLQDLVDDRLFDVRPDGSRHLGVLAERVRAEVVRALGAGRSGRLVGAGRRGRGEHVLDRHHDLQIEGLRGGRRHDLDGLCAAEEPRHLVDRAHGRAEADALHGGLGPGCASQLVEPLEADREMGAALGRGDRVHLVDDDRVHVAQGVAGPAREHEVQRFGRGDEDVRRIHDQPATVRRGRVARAHAHRHGGCRDPEPTGGLADADERRAEVALHIDAEGLERRDVEDPGASGALGVLLRRRALLRGARGSLVSGGAFVSGRSFGRSTPGGALAEHPVDRPEEGRQRLARPGRRDDERMPPARDRLPRPRLRRGGCGERPAEPVLGRGGEAVEHAMR